MNRWAIVRCPYGTMDLHYLLVSQVPTGPFLT
jgi:hypothetical protein